MAPPLRLVIVPGMALARSKAVNTAALAGSDSLGKAAQVGAALRHGLKLLTREPVGRRVDAEGLLDGAGFGHDERTQAHDANTIWPQGRFGVRQAWLT